MLKQSLSIIACSAILSASTTMCYKKDHLDPSTIEFVSLDGGKCDGKLSVSDMKKDGYQVDTMKIQNSKSVDGFNYIYIFKKDGSVKNAVAGVAISNESLKVQLKQIKDDEEKQKKIDNSKSSIEDGKKIYLNSCIECHGKKGEVEAYSSSRTLNSLDYEDMQTSIRDYVLNEKDNGMAIVMKPYADSLVSRDLKNVYKYLEFLNK